LFEEEEKSGKKNLRNPINEKRNVSHNHYPNKESFRKLFKILPAGKIKLMFVANVF
jgi:hypothetical protein